MGITRDNQRHHIRAARKMPIAHHDITKISSCPMAMCALGNFCILKLEETYPRHRTGGDILVYPHLRDGYLLLNLPSAAQLPAEKKVNSDRASLHVNVEPIEAIKGDGGNHKSVWDGICGRHGEGRVNIAEGLSAACR